MAYMLLAPSKKFQQKISRAWWLLLWFSLPHVSLTFQIAVPYLSRPSKILLEQGLFLSSKKADEDEKHSNKEKSALDDDHKETRSKSIATNKVKTNLLSESEPRDSGHAPEGGEDPLESEELIFIPEEMTVDDKIGEGSSMIDMNNGTIDFFPINGDPRAFLNDAHFEKREQAADLESILEVTLPFILPIGGYFFYEKGAALFNSILGSLSPRNWVPADGGTYRAQLITPLMNGIVLPGKTNECFFLLRPLIIAHILRDSELAIALLFATLTSTTIGTLRLRQIEIRQCINDEAGELRALSYLISSLPLETQDLCRKYLTQYTSRIIAESQSEFVERLDDNLSSSTISMTDSELHGVIQLLTKTVAEGDEKMSPLLVDQCFQSVARLRLSRQRRLTALESSYPPEHFALLGTLVLAELTGFLIEADQQVLIFLNAVELRILWSMLIGTFAALSALLFDLLNPFSGIYRVTPAVDQLYIIRLGFQAETKLSLLGIDLKGGDDKDIQTTDSWTDI